MNNAQLLGSEPIRLLEAPRSVSIYYIYIYLAKPKSGAPGLFITGCRVSENKRFWNCTRFDVSGYCLIKSFSSLSSIERFIA